MENKIILSLCLLSLFFTGCGGGGQEPDADLDIPPVEEVQGDLNADSAESDQGGAGEGDDLAETLPEPPLQPDIFEADTDGDGILDDEDNCPLLPNKDQEDLDGDGKGDPCDEDSDGDLIANGEDNCPKISNRGQEDNDNDGAGDLCDCEPDNPDIFQDNLDEPDLASFDSNCDGIDGDKEGAIFVSVERGDDINTGTVEEPLKSIWVALTKASAEGKNIYVEAGDYSLGDAVVADTVRLYGGFKTGGNPFSERCVYPNNCDSSFETILSRPAGETTLQIDSISGESIIDGFKITSHQLESDPVLGTRTMVIRNSAAKIFHSIIEGSDSGETSRTAAVVILGNSGVTLEGNRLEGGNGEDASLGLYVEAADNVTARDNVIAGGAGRFSVGVFSKGASILLNRNTIDASSRFGVPETATAQAVILKDAPGVRMTENILITRLARNQYLLTCIGLEPDPEEITFNLFAPFAINGEENDAIPRSVSCLGEFDFEAADGLDLGWREALENSDYPGDKTFEDLLEEESYRVLDPNFQNWGALR